MPLGTLISLSLSLSSFPANLGQTRQLRPPTNSARISLTRPPSQPSSSPRTPTPALAGALQGRPRAKRHGTAVDAPKDFAKPTTLREKRTAASDSLLRVSLFPHLQWFRHPLRASAPGAGSATTAFSPRNGWRGGKACLFTMGEAQAAKNCPAVEKNKRGVGNTNSRTQPNRKPDLEGMIPSPTPHAMDRTPMPAPGVASQGKSGNLLLLGETTPDGLFGDGSSQDTGTPRSSCRTTRRRGKHRTLRPNASAQRISWIPARIILPAPRMINRFGDPGGHSPMG